jgi:predicted RNA-binding Zn-ribbon protein involved in translation (DUF1610 family)
MTDSPPMMCPACGATMNRHAEKLVERGDHAEKAQRQAPFDGLILEGHACPGCGTTATRPAPAQRDA